MSKQEKSPPGTNRWAAEKGGDTGNVHRVHYTIANANVKHSIRPLSAILTRSVAVAQRNGWREIETALLALIERDGMRACASRN